MNITTPRFSAVTKTAPTQGVPHIRYTAADGQVWHISNRRRPDLTTVLFNLRRRARSAESKFDASFKADPILQRAVRLSNRRAKKESSPRPYGQFVCRDEQLVARPIKKEEGLETKLDSNVRAYDFPVMTLGELVSAIQSSNAPSPVFPRKVKFEIVV